MKKTKIDTLYLIGEDYEIPADPNFLEWTLSDRDSFALHFLKKNKLKTRKVTYLVPRYYGNFRPSTMSVVTTDFKNES